MTRFYFARSIGPDGAASAFTGAVSGESLPFAISGASIVAEPGRVRVTGTGPAFDLQGVKVYRATTGAGFGAAVAVSGVLAVASGAAFNVVAGDATAANLFANADFSAGGTWTMGAGWSIAGGVAVKAPPGSATILQPVTMTGGDTYRFTVNVVAVSYTHLRAHETN